jgi:hypothetical protein
MSIKDDKFLISLFLIILVTALMFVSQLPRVERGNHITIIYKRKTCELETYIDDELLSIAIQEDKANCILDFIHD